MTKGTPANISPVSYTHLVEPVPQRGKLVIFPRCVYTVVNGNVAHFVFGENNLYQLPGFQIITSQTGKVFCYDGRHVPGFNLMQDVYKRQA